MSYNCFVIKHGEEKKRQLWHGKNVVRVLYGTRKLVGRFTRKLRKLDVRTWRDRGLVRVIGTGCTVAGFVFVGGKNRLTGTLAAVLLACVNIGDVARKLFVRKMSLGSV